MKRLFVSVAILPLIHAAGAHAETKISTATTTPVRTSTVANGQPDSITIETAGSIKPTASGAAVTVDSNHAVKNSGVISFEGVSNATGILLQGGFGSAVTNSGTISLLEEYTPKDDDSDGDLDGPFAQGANRFGIRAVGPGAFTGEVRNEGAIAIEGNDSAGISLETRLVGSLVSSGTVGVTGDRGKGIFANSVSGDVRVTGSVNVQGEGSVGVHVVDVDGGLIIQNGVNSTGYRSGVRLPDATRAKFDADDVKQGGGAVRVTGNVGKGVLLDKPPADNSTEDKDEDDDGIEDTLESTALLQALGSAPALDVGAADRTVALGLVGTGDLAYGIVNKGQILANGVNDGVSAVGIRVGQAGGGATTVAGGINTSGSIEVDAYSAQATAVLINTTGSVPKLRNTGLISSEQNGGLHDARGITDLSGTLTLVENSGDIRAVITTPSGVTRTGRAVAIDLSANTTGALVRQAKVATADTPEIVGDVLFGSGADRFEVLAGSVRGDMAFGAGADGLVVDGGASAQGRLSDSDGQLAISVLDGRLAVSNSDAIAISALEVGAKGVLAVNIDGETNTSTRFNVAGAASFANGSRVDVTLSSLVRGSRSFEVVRAGALSVGQTSTTLAGAPFLYQANLRTEQTAGSLFIDIRPKTATELGLNRSGGQAYAGIFESLDRDAAVERAFLNQTTQEGFQHLYDQMLPDHSGGALMSAAAISAAVSSATAQPMAIGTDHYTGIWAQEIMFEIERDREDAAGFRSSGFGLAAGLDLLGEINAVGLSTSFVSVDYRDRGAAAGEEVSMNMLGGGLYWRLSTGGLQANVRGGVGYIWFDGDRRLSAEGLQLRNEADWTGWTLEGHAGVSYTVSAGAFYARPELSVDFIRLSEEGYTESGGGAGFDLTVDDRKGELLTGQAALAIGARFGDEIWWSPEVKVGYRSRLAGDPGKTTAQFGDGDPFTLDPEDAFDGGITGRVGVRGGTASVLYAVDAGGTFEGSYTEYDVRATVRFQF